MSVCGSHPHPWKNVSHSSSLLLFSLLAGDSTGRKATPTLSSSGIRSAATSPVANSAPIDSGEALANPTRIVIVAEEEDDESHVIPPPPPTPSTPAVMSNGGGGGGGGGSTTTMLSEILLDNGKKPSGGVEPPPPPSPPQHPILSRLKQWTERLNPMSKSTEGTDPPKSPGTSKRHGGLSRLFSRSGRSTTPQPASRRGEEEDEDGDPQQHLARCSSLDNVAKPNA